MADKNVKTIIQEVLLKKEGCGLNLLKRVEIS
jgi:hypothetical protein